MANTVAVTDPLPTLSYWSLNVIVLEILAPLCVADPLSVTPKVRLPLPSTTIAALEEVNDCTVAPA